MSLTEKTVGEEMQIVYAVQSICEKEGLNTEHFLTAIEKELAEEIGEKQYADKKIDVSISKNTGIISISKRFLVVEDEKFDDLYGDFITNLEEEKNLALTVPLNNIQKKKYDDLISLSSANERYKDQNPEINKIIVDKLPGIQSSYLIVKLMKPRIEKVLNSLIRTKQYNDYKSRIGTLVVGVVKKSIDLKAGSRSIMLDLSGTEAVLPFSSLIKGEMFRKGDRVKCVVEKVEFSLLRPQIVVSRASNAFLSELFKQQVPEIYDGLVEIKSVARDSGSRAKIAVYSTDKNIDPVGACIGIRGNRINAVSAELNNEKIDVIEYSNDVPVFLVNAIKPIKVVKVILDEENRRIDLIIHNENLSMIIGRKGQNIHLLSSLIGYKIEVLSDTEVSKKKMDDFVKGTNLFMSALNVEEVIAQLLITDGFTTVEEVANSDISTLAYIEGFDVNIAEELHRRANEYLNEKQNHISQLIEKYGIDDEFLKFLSLNNSIVEKILSSGLLTIKSIAELSNEEFKDITKVDEISDDEINKLIMRARRKVGWLE
jgi:N utilization substance protein A